VPAQTPSKSGAAKMILVGIALILLGMLIGVFASGFVPTTSAPTPSPLPVPTATPVPQTQSLESIENNFTIQLPVGWKKQETATEVPFMFQYQAGDNSTFEILVRDLAKGQDLESYLAEQDKISLTAFEGKPSKRILSSTPITLNGLVGVEREEEFLAAGLLGRVIYLPGNSKIFSFSFIPGDNTTFVLETQVYKERQIIFDSFTLIGDQVPLSYTCPQGEWVDCMPGPDRPSNFQCQADFLTWAKANCPGFKGAAL